jgi:hypothetical protein
VTELGIATRLTSRYRPSPTPLTTPRARNSSPPDSRSTTSPPDHLAGDDYRTLTPDDLLDLIDAGALGWNAERQTGVAFHMLSSLAVAGFIGATAIGNTPEEARAAFDHTRDVLSTTSLKEHF